MHKTFYDHYRLFLGGNALVIDRSFVDRETRERLLNGKAPYNRPPRTNYFRSATFDITFFTNQATPIRRSTVQKSSPSVKCPGFVMKSTLINKRAI